MTSVSHHTTKELVMALRNAAPFSTTPDLLTEAANRLDPMQELADLWRAEDTANEQAAEISRMREALVIAEDALSRQSWQWTGAGPHPQDVIEAARAALEAGK